MTDLQRRLIEAGDRYNGLMRQVGRSDITRGSRARIADVQRRIAKHHFDLAPFDASDAYRRAMSTTADEPALPNDDHGVLGQCIAAGENYAELFQQLTTLEATSDFAQELWRLFKDNGDAFDHIVGFEIIDRPSARAG